MQIVDIVAVIAMVVAIVGWIRVGKLTKAIDRTLEEMDALRSHVSATSNIQEQKIDDIRNTMKRQVPAESGTQQFHADMTVAEVLAFHPEAGGVMASFHLGGCSSCAISEHHVLGPAAESYGVDINALLGALNNLLDGGSVPEKQPKNEGLLQIDSNI